MPIVNGELVLDIVSTTTTSSLSSSSSSAIVSDMSGGITGASVYPTSTAAWGFYGTTGIFALHIIFQVVCYATKPAKYDPREPKETELRKKYRYAQAISLLHSLPVWVSLLTFGFYFANQLTQYDTTTTGSTIFLALAITLGAQVTSWAYRYFPSRRMTIPYLSASVPLHIVTIWVPLTAMSLCGYFFFSLPTPGDSTRLFGITGLFFAFWAFVGIAHAGYRMSFFGMRAAQWMAVFWFLLIVLWALIPILSPILSNAVDYATLPTIGVVAALAQVGVAVIFNTVFDVISIKRCDEINNFSGESSKY